jgi:6-pyruvoyltetrahydropterin/6-carboxytetrahydropterin synthase
MYRIGKKFTFDAAHCLPHLPADHKCSRPHGHTYEVHVTLAAETLTEEGWVFDYGDMKPIKEFIDRKLDHRDLNTVLHGFPTTAECLARWLYDKFKTILNLPKTVRLESVVVKETPNTFAEYSPNNRSYL